MKTKIMKPHQQRVIDEKSQLDEKIKKLTEFIESSTVFSGLIDAERAKLIRQRHFMTEYSGVLGERIDAF